MRLLISVLILSCAFAAEDKAKPTEPKELSDLEIMQLKYLQEKRRASQQAIALAYQAIKDARLEAEQAERETMMLIGRYCGIAGIPKDECQIDLEKRKPVRVPKDKP